MRYAAYTQNLLVLSNLSLSPFVMRYGEVPDLTRLKIFGCTAYVIRDKTKSDFILDPKWEPRGITGCFMDMADDGGEASGAAIKGCAAWSLETGARIITTNDFR